MSLAEEQPIACPACKKGATHRVQRSVDATKDPELKAQLLDGRLFLFTCPSCGHAARVVHPELFYSDARLELMIQLDPLGKVEPAAATPLPRTTRIVRDSNALIEKVKIVDAELDDRIVEAVKLLARTSMGPAGEGKRLLFEAADGEGTAARLRFTLLSQDGSLAGLALPRDAYDNLAARLEADRRLVHPGPWAVVDGMFARTLLAA